MCASEAQTFAIYKPDKRKKHLSEKNLSPLGVGKIHCLSCDSGLRSDSKCLGLYAGLDFQLLNGEECTLCHIRVG